MKNQDHTITITVNQTAEEVFKKINNIPKWWTNDFEGSSGQHNDEFIINHIGTNYSGTKMIFELTSDGGTTVLNFTHEGLVPEKECYSRCTQG